MPRIGIGKMPHIFSYLKPYWAVPTDAYWRHAQKIAQEIVVTRKRDLVSPPVGPVRLVKLRIEPSCGVEYNMTIEVTGKNGIHTSYAVKVYRLPSGLPYEIASFDKIDSSDIKTECPVSDKKQAALSDGKSSSIIARSGKTSDEKASSTIKGKKRASHSTISDDNEGSTELLSEVTGRLCTRGFYILLEQIRSERPTLSYAKERKMASSRWRKLPEDEKMAFIGEVAKRQKA